MGGKSSRRSLFYQTARCPSGDFIRAKPGFPRLLYIAAHADPPDNNDNIIDNTVVIYHDNKDLENWPRKSKKEFLVLVFVLHVEKLGSSNSNPGTITSLSSNKS